MSQLRQFAGKQVIDRLSRSLIGSRGQKIARLVQEEIDEFPGPDRAAFDLNVVRRGDLRREIGAYLAVHSHPAVTNKCFGPAA
jgi:hypothetical protein